MMNCIWFQIAMLAYNLNCWLQLFNREEGGQVGSMRHTTLATARLRFLFLAAKIWRHAGRVGISYSDHYEDRGLFQRLDGPGAGDCTGRRWFPAGVEDRIDLRKRARYDDRPVHKILCGLAKCMRE